MRVMHAKEGYLAPLLAEMGPSILRHWGPLYDVAPDGPVGRWAQNIWREAHIQRFESISDAAKILRNIQRNWALVPPESHFRRAKLIEEKLPLMKPRAVVFTDPPPTSPMGGWTLVDAHHLLYSADCSSPYPRGEVSFLENKTDPPSRAYLKLWEFFHLSQRWPKQGERCLDLGASPGGWTWVLDQLGADVIGVDKAPLEIDFSGRVQFIQESAFAVDPHRFGPVDWLFSDVICYPERLLGLVEKWVKAGTVRNFVCTIKFQGEDGDDVLDEFLKIQGAELRYLYHNKHEIMFSRLE